jgi:hypothetical protein
LYLGNDAIYQVGFPVNCPTGCRLTTDQPLWLYSGFTLSGSDEIWYGDANRFGAASFSSPTPCLTSVWHPEVPITLEITSGSELGSFVDNAGNDLGKTVTKKASEFNTFSYLANGDPPQGSEGTVVITATSANITVEKSFKVRRRVPDHFAITLEHDEIAFTEASKIFVQAKDASDQDVVFDDNELLFFTVIENGQYGTFINKSRDTVKTAPPTLGDITYADARSGQIRFAAVKKNPAVREVAKIRVTWQGDETKKGETEIAILEQTLKIIIIGLGEVRPTIPGEIRVAFPGEPTSQTSFRVRLTRGGQLVADHAFELSSSYIDGSGGHVHTQPRRATDPEGARYNNYGFFELAGSSPPKRGEPLTAATTLAGGTLCQFQASEFGDTMRVRARSLSNALLKDSVSVLERVRDLTLLPTNDAVYEKIGGTPHHLGPPGSPADNNHWGDWRITSWLPEIAQAYLNELEPDNVIKYNDISLPLGGGFDVNGGWEADIAAGASGHETHRVGRSVDVRTNPFHGDGVPLENLESLIGIVRRFNSGATIRIHSPNRSSQHFHIEFRFEIGR